MSRCNCTIFSLGVNTLFVYYTRRIARISWRREKVKKMTEIKMKKKNEEEKKRGTKLKSIVGAETWGGKISSLMFMHLTKRKSPKKRYNTDRRDCSLAGIFWRQKYSNDDPWHAARGTWDCPLSEEGCCKLILFTFQTEYHPDPDHSIRTPFVGAHRKKPYCSPLQPRSTSPISPLTSGTHSDQGTREV